MMQGVKNYVLAQAASGNNPIHKTYHSHLRIDPHQNFTVELIYFKSVHASYRHLPAGGRKIDNPSILLKEVFPNPLSPDQTVFVEAQKEGLKRLSSLIEEEVSFVRKL
jgi:hypothetical protein